MRHCSCSLYITAHCFFSHFLTSPSHPLLFLLHMKVMLHDQNPSFLTSFVPNSVNVNVMIPTNLKTMDHVHGVELPLEGNPRFHGRRSGNPFAESFQDPLCKLNLKETSEFVRSLPVVSNDATERDLKRFEAPPAPGRSFLSFNVGSLSRKSFPSKWDDAEKWLISSSCHGSPAHAPRLFKKFENFNEHQLEVFGFAEKARVSNAVSTTARSLKEVSDVPLKDKFTDDAEPTLAIVRHSEPSTKDASTKMVHHRDAGTEMTPLGSSTNSQCHTPFKSSGPLSMDVSQLQVCHLAKLQLGTRYDSAASSSIWSSKEEEEEEVSKSLRHSETGNVCFRSASQSRAAAWEEEEKTKSCNRYQREEAKIQAWVNLQNAKAEAKSRKLEVKIQKMRSNLEEKLMRKMTDVHRKAEEWRISAQHRHVDQTQVEKTVNRRKSKVSGHISCGCYP